MAKRPFAALPAPPPWQSELTTVGVTGTNGKTSTTALVAGALRSLASPVARVTTVGCFLDDEPFDASFDYHGFLRTMEAARDAGGRYAAIELTSESLALGFAKAWPCRVGVFTNLTRDHLDAHGSAEHYLASKAQLFMQLPPEGTAVLNAADPASELLAEIVPDHARILRYGVPSRGDCAGADHHATDVDVTWEGTTVTLNGGSVLRVAAIGEVFAENALAAWVAACALGVEENVACAALQRLPAPPGRFEVVGRSPYVVVDYAHTPDALQRTLATARALTSGKVVVVFGAGGERDQAKRPMMGEAASSADHIVVTSDNPRGEDPDRIADQIHEGVTATSVSRELDRATAIQGAVKDAGAQDVVVIAGKGHESTQDRDGAVHRFSDREIALAAIDARS